MGCRQNHVKLKDGIIFYTQCGKQTQEVAINTLSVIRFLAGGLPEVRLLADYTFSGEMDKEAIEQGYYALEVLPIDKAAIIGASPYLKDLVTKMSEAAGKGNVIYFASSRKEAIAWLNK
jgi:hypothetical protein